MACRSRNRGLDIRRSLGCISRLSAPFSGRGVSLADHAPPPPPPPVSLSTAASSRTLYTCQHLFPSSSRRCDPSYQYRYLSSYPAIFEAPAKPSSNATCASAPGWGRRDGQALLDPYVHPPPPPPPPGAREHQGVGAFESTRCRHQFKAPPPNLNPFNYEPFPVSRIQSPCLSPPVPSIPRPKGGVHRSERAAVCRLREVATSRRVMPTPHHALPHFTLPQYCSSHHRSRPWSISSFISPSSIVSLEERTVPHRQTGFAGRTPRAPARGGLSRLEG